MVWSWGWRKDGDREGRERERTEGCTLGHSQTPDPGIGLAVSILASRGQRELEDAEPPTQGRRKQFDLELVLCGD